MGYPFPWDFPFQEKPNSAPKSQAKLPGKVNSTPTPAEHQQQLWNPKFPKFCPIPAFGAGSFYQKKKKKSGQTFQAGIPKPGPKSGILTPGIFLKFHFQSSTKLDKSISTLATGP